MMALHAAPCAPVRLATVRSRQSASAPRRGSVSARRGARSLTVRASAEGFDPVKSYQKISDNIPPIVTAAAIPVVALSLLSKSLFGSGLPGPLLGTVEGLSWLLLPLGAGALIPRLGGALTHPRLASARLNRPTHAEVLKGGDFSTDAVLEILKRDNRGESASERVARITAQTDPRSALGMQLADLERARKEKASMSDAERAASARRNSELALLAINGVGKGVTKADVENAEKLGRAALLAQPVGETMAQGMTVANFGKDVTKMSDAELGAVNLSTPDANKASAEH